MADWWNPGDFNLWDAGSSDWWNPGDFNLGFDWSNMAWPTLDWSGFNLGFNPSDWGNFNFDWSLPNFGMDPLALPSFTGMEGFQPAFMQGGGANGFGMPALGMAEAPQTLSDALGFKGTAAPTTTVPTAAMPAGGDPLVNLMGTDQGLGLDPAWAALAESPISTGSYGQPGMTAGPGTPLSLTGAENAPVPVTASLGVGGTPYGQPGGAASDAATPSLGDLQRQLLQAQLAQANRGNQPASGWETLAKLGAAFGPTALGAAGLGLQAANRPQRNPLEDELIRAKIASTGLQDQLARDRLAFERDQAAAQLEAQQSMQNALLESRRPGGQANITALLQGNPQLAALYNALTNKGTGLAGGTSPEFEAMVTQLAQVDITELRRQADQLIAQAKEDAIRQGINPAARIAEVEQRFLQESAKARANARNSVIQQLIPALNIFQGIGGLFGNLFQTPQAAGA